MHHPKLDALVRRDGRYAYEAYEFIFAALAHTQKLLGKPVPETPDVKPDRSHHVSGPELLHGVRDLALREFGFLARTVFRLWGIERTGDFGEIIFNLIEAGLMLKTEDDCKNDFHDVYDLDEALVHGYEIGLEEAE